MVFGCSFDVTSGYQLIPSNAMLCLPDKSCLWNVHDVFMHLAVLIVNSKIHSLYPWEILFLKKTLNKWRSYLLSTYNTCSLANDHSGLFAMLDFSVGLWNCLLYDFVLWQFGILTMKYFSWSLFPLMSENSSKNIFSMCFFLLEEDVEVVLE